MMSGPFLFSPDAIEMAGLPPCARRQSGCCFDPWVNIDHRPAGERSSSSSWEEEEEEEEQGDSQEIIISYTHTHTYETIKKMSTLSIWCGYWLVILSCGILRWRNIFIFINLLLLYLCTLTINYRKKRHVRMKFNHGFVKKCLSL